MMKSTQSGLEHFHNFTIPHYAFKEGGTELMENALGQYLKYQQMRGPQNSILSSNRLIGNKISHINTHSLPQKNGGTKSMMKSHTPSPLLNIKNPRTSDISA